jgi:hypothetical protein
MQSRNRVFIGIIWKVMYFKGVWTLIILKEIVVPLLKRIVYWPAIN